MDMQFIIDAVNTASCSTRGDYHLTLGELNEALASADDDALVLFDDGAAVGEFDSYRGYYTDIALGDADSPKTVAEFRKNAAAALETVFEGYKGGKYPATPSKPLWRSGYGSASGVGIMGVDASVEKRFLLKTKQVD